MPQHSSDRDESDRTRAIEVLPHLSAPIDEGPFYPDPPLGLWGRGVRIAIVAAIVGTIAVVAFSHGAFVR